ncbi:MAG: 2-phospho-L-lactate transferase [Chloroflexi bacterium]|nr:2-phospho-L-lactate transferase [Chloroflexota bacterium]MBA3739697.1 2-phospho-L-lactate transferase [Chloroflexota bacterium]
MKVTLLAGGTGGTKLAHGFALMGPRVELTVIANVGDDAEIHGLHVSPDIDALLYTLAGLIDTERGWGVRGDTFTAHAMLERYGEPAWFTVGDADLATHAERTRRMRKGASLTDATAAMATALGITIRILPATDDRYRTIIETDEGPLDFQDYFVRLRQEPEVRAVRFEGDARPTAAMLGAIGNADLVVIGPSNPLVSIGPILALPGVRDAVKTSHAAKIAVSPIIAGRALKGPADRMLASLGHDVTAVGVARLYSGLVDRFVVDEADAGLRPEIEMLGLAVDVLPTVMRSDAVRAALAEALVGQL